MGVVEFDLRGTTGQGKAACEAGVCMSCHEYGRRYPMHCFLPTVSIIRYRSKGGLNAHQAYW